MTIQLNGRTDDEVEEAEQSEADEGADKVKYSFGYVV
jgi:hypothetical protein